MSAGMVETIAILCVLAAFSIAIFGRLREALGGIAEMGTILGELVDMLRTERGRVRYTGEAFDVLEPGVLGEIVSYVDTIERRRGSVSDVFMVGDLLVVRYHERKARGAEDDKA